MINARAETLAQKPIFRNALKRRRCLIPTSGFYEWRKNSDGTKTPMYIRMKDGRPFAFGGLWERWNSPDGSNVRSCTIITGKPNELVRSIHDRMPLIIPGQLYQRWLDPAEMPSEQVEEMMSIYAAEEMEAVSVSRLVNDPKVDEPRCIESVTAEEPAPKAITRSKRDRAKEDQDQLF
jgi:putative SOS response-associated peptidase YedK